MTDNFTPQTLNLTNLFLNNEKAINFRNLTSIELHNQQPCSLSARNMKMRRFRLLIFSKPIKMWKCSTEKRPFQENLRMLPNKVFLKDFFSDSL